MTQRTRRSAAGTRRGFSLIEIMVAVTLLAIVSASLASMTVQIARSGQTQAIATQRNARLLAEGSRLEAMPYDSLKTESGVRKVTALPFPHTRTIAINFGPDSSDIRVIIAPANTKFRPETLSFQRMHDKAGNPFALP